MFAFRLPERLREQHGPLHADAGKSLIAQFLEHGINAFASGGETFLGSVEQLAVKNTFFLRRVTGSTGTQFHEETSR